MSKDLNDVAPSRDEVSTLHVALEASTGGRGRRPGTAGRGRDAQAGAGQHGRSSGVGREGLRRRRRAARPAGGCRQKRTAARMLLDRPSQTCRCGDWRGKAARQGDSPSRCACPLRGALERHSKRRSRINMVSPNGRRLTRASVRCRERGALPLALVPSLGYWRGSMGKSGFFRCH